MDSLGSTSPTAAMADTYESHQGRLAEFRDRLKYVEGAAGLAVAVGGKVVAVDLFDKPATCRKVWDRLLSGVVMDALEAAAGGEAGGRCGGGRGPGGIRDAPWKQSPAVGSRRGVPGRGGGRAARLGPDLQRGRGAWEPGRRGVRRRVPRPRSGEPGLRGGGRVQPPTGRPPTHPDRVQENRPDRHTTCLSLHVHGEVRCPPPSKHSNGVEPCDFSA